MVQKKIRRCKDLDENLYHRPSQLPQQDGEKLCMLAHFAELIVMRLFLTSLHDISKTQTLLSWCNDTRLNNFTDLARENFYACGKLVKNCW
jgi:hypothetical protein